MTRIVASKANPWLANPRPDPRAVVRLFCFPYSGAGASIFYSWPGTLPPLIQVCPVQLPGRGNRLAEPSFIRLLPLVQAAAEALLPYLDKPFAFFGHSMGALVSFELARHLSKQHNLSPVHLFVSGHNAPHIPDREPPIHALPEPEFMAKLRQLNGMRKGVLEDAELMQLVLPILRADFAACETYVYQAASPLECPISALGGLQDEYVTRDGLEAWREQTSASFYLRMFPGDHFYLNTDRQLLLRTLARELTVSGSQPPQTLASKGLKADLALANLERSRG
jgi:medium-chain acyl-[acyl-carrier-protein] hydrolase